MNLPRSPKPWRWFDIVGLILIGVLIAVGVGAALWGALSSERYLEPRAVAYVEVKPGKWDVIFERKTPRGPVTARWNTEISVVGTSRDCPASGVAPYQVIEGSEITGKLDDVAIFDAPASLVPCLEGPRPLIVRQAWTVMLWDVFPLRPVSMITRIE